MGALRASCLKGVILQGPPRRVFCCRDDCHKKDRFCYKEQRTRRVDREADNTGSNSVSAFSVVPARQKSGAGIIRPRSSDVLVMAQEDRSSGARLLKGRRQQRVWDANVLGQRSATYGVYDLLRRSRRARHA